LREQRAKNWIEEKLDYVLYNIKENIVMLTENFTSYEYYDQYELLSDRSDILELLRDFKVEDAEEAYVILKDKMTDFIDQDIFKNEGVYLNWCDDIMVQFKQIDQFLYITKDFIARYRNTVTQN